MSKLISIPSKLYSEKYGKAFNKPEYRTPLLYELIKNVAGKFGTVLPSDLQDWKFRYPEFDETEPPNFPVITRRMKVVWKGLNLILVGNEKSGGALCTIGQLDNFSTSFAHLFADGKIRRHGQIIGSIEEIIFIPEKGLNDN